MAIESHHFDFMLEAIREAEASIAQGGLPIGAVLTRDNKIIARGHNNRVQENNADPARRDELPARGRRDLVPRYRHVHHAVAMLDVCRRARSVQGVSWW